MSFEKRPNKPLNIQCKKVAVRVMRSLPATATGLYESTGFDRGAAEKRAYLGRGPGGRQKENRTFPRLRASGAAQRFGASSKRKPLRYSVSGMAEMIG